MGSEADFAMPLKLNGPLRVQGTLFPMCGMNLAFNRELIGPAMYFGLMGDGQPLGRYDDMWAGWCSKVQLEENPSIPFTISLPLAFLFHYAALVQCIIRPA